MSIENVTVNGVSYPLAPKELPVADRPTSEWMAVTPLVAEVWLRANRSNRNMRARHAGSQSRDMRSGNWQINGETVKLSRPLLAGEVEDLPEGYVLFLDGQHRFEACIESNQPFVTLVVWGLEPETRATMDAGVNRTMGDVLKMNGKQHSPVLASVLRRVYMWNQGNYRFNGNSAPTHAELQTLLESDAQAFMRAAEKGYYVKTLFRDVSPSVVGVAYYLCAKASEEDAPEFFERLRDGAELPVGSPILALRNRLGRERMERRSIPYHQLALILKAWNHHRDGNTIAKLQQSPDDPMPLPR
jgi:hypothetical protein